MPPKKAAKGGKKGGDKGSGDGKGGAPSDDVGQRVHELSQQVDTLRRERDKEAQERSYLALERDKISSFWEISKKDLEDKQAELRNKDREMEEIEERHQMEIKVYKQKVKHLLYEHQNNIANLKVDNEMTMKLQSDEAAQHENVLSKERRALKIELKEAELSHEDMVRELQLEHAKERTKLRQVFERNVKELEHKAEVKIKTLREDLELRRKQEVHEVEERKNAHINELMRKHEKAFADIKAYYNEIAHNNLDLIKSLKSDVADMKKKEVSNEKLMYEIAQENKRLSEPLAAALKEGESLRHTLAAYEKDKQSLAQTKARLREAEKHRKNIEWEHEVLQQRFKSVEAERDELYQQFEAEITNVQQRNGLRTMILERKITAMEESLETKEAQLTQVLKASSIDPNTLKEITHKIEDVVQQKNAIIQSLQHDIAKVSKAHNDLIRVYESKLAEYGIPIQELGFRPLATKATTTAPAGLVAAVI